MGLMMEEGECCVFPCSTVRNFSEKVTFEQRRENKKKRNQKMTGRENPKDKGPGDGASVARMRNSKATAAGSE